MKYLLTTLLLLGCSSEEQKPLPPHPAVDKQYRCTEQARLNCVMGRSDVETISCMPEEFKRCMDGK